MGLLHPVSGIAAERRKNWVSGVWSSARIEGCSRQKLPNADGNAQPVLFWWHLKDVLLRAYDFWFTQSFWCCWETVFSSLSKYLLISDTKYQPEQGRACGFLNC